MKKLILYIFLLVYSSFSQAALTAEVSKNPISIGESFQLTLTLDNINTPSVPDLSMLQNDFHIIATERRVQYNVINGQANSLHQWIILLEPTRVGQLDIPPVTINNQSSQAITITVLAKGQTKENNNQIKAQSNDDFQLITQVDTKNPYLNQQVILTVRLLAGMRVMDTDYQAPKVEDALMVRLGSPSHYQKINNGKVYAIEEQRYAIFPQKSGELTIISPKYQAITYAAIPKKINLSNKDIKLDVKPIPKNYKDKYWIAAKKLELKDKYDSTNKTFAIGDSLTRSITIKSIGAPAQLIPKLKFPKNDYLSVYPEKEEETNIVRKGQVVGLTKIKLTYLFNKAGNTEIPALNISWFNTNTKNKEVSQLPSRAIRITQPLAGSTNTINKQKPSSYNTSSAKPQKPLRRPATEKNLWPWIISSFFALAWVLTLFLWLRQKNNNSKLSSKKTLRALRDACNNNQAEQAKQALIDWFKLNWPQKPILNINELAKTIREPKLKKEIQGLSEYLYSNKTKQAWQGASLWQAVNNYKKRKLKKNSGPNSLPPINPG